MRKLVLMSLAALGIVACSSNDDLGEGTNTSTKGDVYASFSINLGDQAHSRATDGGLDQGTTEEQKVQKARVVMYANGRVAYSVDFSPVTVTDTSVKSQAIKVTKQNYEVAVLINANAELVDKVAVGKPVSALKEAIASNTEVGAGEFFMSNAQGLVPILASDLKTSEDEAKNAPVKIQVDRILAKVTVDVTKEGEELSSTAAVTPEGWILDVINQKNFPLRELALTSEGTNEVVNHKDPSQSTPRIQRYATDPNFQGIDLAGKTEAERKKILEEEFSYWDKPTFGEGEGVAMKAASYAPENTFAGGETNVLESQATRVILKAKYMPNSLELTENEDWISHMGSAMKIATFNDYVNQALQLGWNESNAGFTPSFTNEIKNLVFLAAYMKREKTGDDFKEKYKHLAIVEFGNVDALNDLIDKAKDEQGPEGELINIKLTEGQLQEIGITFKVGKNDEPFAVSNLNFYKGGSNYYPLYIKHFKGEIKNAYGKYGVVRNNYYQVNVSKIERPGSPIITPPYGPGKPTVPTTPVDPTDPKPTDPKPTDPEQPIDKDEVWVAYDVEILPWLVRVQEEEIK